MNAWREQLVRFLASPTAMLVAVVLLTSHADVVQGQVSGVHVGRSSSLSDFQCGGLIEDLVWGRWEKVGKDYMVSKLLGARLAAQGDTYALYDFEITFHNLLAMAQRCGRVDRQFEMAEVVRVAYGQLGPASTHSEGVGWVCRGGSICNRRNRLLDTEVLLNSVQFLAFAGSSAVELPRDPSRVRADALKAETALVIYAHLRRWNDASSRTSLRKRIAARPSDVTNGASTLFLSDIDLWMISVYADFAGLVEQQPKLRHSLGLYGDQLAVMGEHLNLLLLLLQARTTHMVALEEAGVQATVADLDRGFWRRYFDNRYAGYTSSEPPVRCVPDRDDSSQLRVEVIVDPVSIPLVADLGWDISHARRLVHLFDALERNRRAVGAVYGLTSSVIPSAEVAAAFARQLRLKVWNQSRERPLFANYFSGVNGWYRVAYDNGTGRCREGYPPYGLSDSFPTGGYATWVKFDPALGLLAQRIYGITTSSDSADRAFVDKFYRALGSRVAPNVRELNELMFWPTLIGNL